jgi:hypothetical protein
MDQDYRKKLNRLKKQFLEGQPVIDIPPGTVRLADNSKDAIKAAKKEAVERARANGKQVVKTPEADIVFDASGVKKSLDHSINQEKLDAIPYIPEGIRKGMTIDISNDLDGYPIKNIHKALPVKTNSDKDLLVLRSRHSNGQDARFYNHHLFRLKDLKEKSDAHLPPVAYPDHTPEGQVAGNPPPVAYSGYNPVGQSAGNKGIAYIKNILHDILNVKENDD